MRFPYLAVVGVFLIVSCFLIGGLVRQQVDASTTQEGDMDNDGVEDSTYSMSIVLLKDGEVTSYQPYDLLAGDTPVDAVRVSLTWTVTGEDIDLSTFHVEGHVDLMQAYEVEIKEIPQLKDFVKDSVTVSSTDLDANGHGSFTADISLDSIIEENTVDGVLMCGVQAYVTYYVTDIYGNQLNDAFTKRLGMTLTSYTPTGTFSVVSTWSYTAQNIIQYEALTGQAKPISPLWMMVIAGFVLVVLGFLLMKR